MCETPIYNMTDIVHCELLGSFSSWKLINNNTIASHEVIVGNYDIVLLS